MTRSTPPHAAALALALALALPLSLQAQQPLNGVVVDGGGQPLAGAVVVLHSVSDAGGEELDRDTTGSDGAFRLTVPDDAGGVVFAATRIDGDLFVGDTFRGAPPAEYVLRAGPGVEPFPMPATPALPAQRAPVGTADDSHGGFWVALIALALLAAVALITLRVRRRPPASRELMLEIARIDRTTAEGTAADRLRARREELMQRLEQTAAHDRAGGL